MANIGLKLTHIAITTFFVLYTLNEKEDMVFL